jgi:hypothetical protein
VPLARLLRKFYAGACARLEAQGLEPAVYRTIILRGAGGSPGAETPPEPRAPHPEWTTPMPGPWPGTVAVVLPSMPAPLHSMPMPLASRPMPLTSMPAPLIPMPVVSPLPVASGAAALGSAAEGGQARGGGDDDGDQSLAELTEIIGELFDVVIGDRRLDDDMQHLVARFREPAVHYAWSDATVLGDYAHPLWQLMDRMALQGQTHPPAGNPEREDVLRVMHGLLDALTESPDPNVLHWAGDRLRSYERARFEERYRANKAEMRNLQVLEDQAVSADTTSFVPGALDLVHLDTVPGHLVEDAAAAADGDSSADTLQHLRSGDWVRLFMQGRWTHAQLLWYGTHREYWLFADGTTPHVWAIRRRALQRLAEMHLLSPAQPRSLIRDAANRVLNRIGAPPQH